MLTVYTLAYLVAFILALISIFEARYPLLAVAVAIVAGALLIQAAT
jgi:hypothetical protein